MFENIDELIDINLKLLFNSKSQFMMRINFKDEYGFNLKNSKVFAEILEHKGLVVLEKNHGFRCDLTEIGKQIYCSGGWMRYKRNLDGIADASDLASVDTQVKKMEKSFLKKVIVAGIIVVVLCFFVTLITVEIFRIH